MEITIEQIDQAAQRLENIIMKTPLQYSKRLSKQYNANIYIKREDLQEVRSFKIRGAYNKMASLTEEEKKRGVVCASAGNHAQGVAYSCSSLKIHGVIFMPVITPLQKIDKVKHFGDGYIEIQLVGNTYDEASKASKEYCKEKNAIYVHPFDDPLTIAGQGTVGREIYEEISNTTNFKYPISNDKNTHVIARSEGRATKQSPKDQKNIGPETNGIASPVSELVRNDVSIDYIIVPIGGGGLISGVSSYLIQKHPDIKIIGAEPLGAPGMYESLKQNKVISLNQIDTFVDGAAVQRVGDITFEICKKNVEKIILVPEGKDCMIMIELYQNEGIIAEPAGALSVAALDDIKNEIKGKTVVCILSGGNNDILRYPEIMERSLVYQGRKHYFILEFAQKPGQLRKFVDRALGSTDDIVRFEYIKKTNKERGAALVGIELKDKKDYEPLLQRMNEIGLNFHVLKSGELLYDYLI